jgi:hypothetical protein
VNAHLADTLADGLAIAKIAAFGLLDARQDSRLGNDIFQSVDPFRRLLGQQNRVYALIVAAWLQACRKNPCQLGQLGPWFPPT